ncbi:MAG TPA: phenylphosphate carboxylase subunit beta [Chloroflexi bacterium]|nr:phenylphosphate carboxylase subunit beta [Chloroflexota bacterium]
MKNIREWISICEREGDLKRITAEVDWNLEISHIAKLNEEQKGPALLFENVKGYDIPVLASALTTSKRLAITLGMPLHYSICDMGREWVKLTGRELIRPRIVNPGPVTEMVIEENDVDLLRDFPVPKFYPKDGGRYIGTAVYLLTQDMETGWVNMGTYRMMVHDRNHTGIQIIKGKHADMHLKQYQKAGKLMPAAAVIGCDPVHFFASSVPLPYQVSEYDIIGALRKEPVEVFKSDLTGLLLPAHAEIVLEGFVDPNDVRPEGPFGEYTGYYSGADKEEWPKQVLHVTRILRRRKPVFWVTSVGKPITDTHVINSLTRTGTLWSDLEAMRVPGVQSVYVLPQSAGRFWAIISLKTMYPGHSNHAAMAAHGCSTGHYGMKGVIVVDADIHAEDLDRVIWALSVRYDPARSTEVISRARSTPLDPSLPIQARHIGSKIIMDATIPYEWDRKPEEIFLDEEVARRVKARWNELGLD